MNAPDQKAIAEAFALLVGLFAEAAGIQKTAYHLAAAIEGAQKIRPDAVRDALLIHGLRLVLIKARNKYPDDEVIGDLAAKWLGSPPTPH